jgi:superoxide dismutase, Cu-Zn family
MTMMIKYVLPFVASAFLISCVSGSATQSATASQPSAFARMLAYRDGQLVPVGKAQIVERSDRLDLLLNLDKGYLPDKGGPYGMHLHAVGRCEGPDFATAGPHWNPMGKQHGHDNPAGAHAGDLANLNLMIGTADNSVGTIKDMNLAELLDADGAALVIHEKADDYRTDPSGNSGKRIICGVFERP